jgi:hypothetical protein
MNARAALRIAWREARRARGRSAMVLAMIALPVLALSFLAVEYDTFTLNPVERADRLMGRTQTVLSWSQTQAVEQDPSELTAFGIALNSTTPEQPRTPQETDAQLLAPLPAKHDPAGSEHGARGADRHRHRRRQHSHVRRRRCAWRTRPAGQDRPCTGRAGSDNHPMWTVGPAQATGARCAGGRDRHCAGPLSARRLCAGEGHRVQVSVPRGLTVTRR